jgi:hypothetical protein
MADDRRREEELRERPEMSPAEVRKRLWSEPGGDEEALREAKSLGPGDITEDHSEETAAETPETTKHLSDAHIDEPGKAPSARRS